MAKRIFGLITRIIVLLVLFFSFNFLLSNLTFAQQDSPGDSEAKTISGGDSFESAEEVSVNSYLGSGITADESRYFKVTGFGPGEQLFLKADFEGTTSGEITLYDSNRAELAREIQYSDDMTPLEIFWLPGTEATSDTYYFAVKAGFEDDISSYTLDVEKNNFFDVGSTLDTGDTPEAAIYLEEGTYTGYLAGKYGSDHSDFYGLELKRGQVVIVTVSPPSGRRLDSITFYDSKNKLLDRKHWPNPGAIVEAPLLVQETGTYFVELSMGVDVQEKPRLEYSIEVDIKPFSEAREYFEEDEIPEGFDIDAPERTERTLPGDGEVREIGGLIARFTQGVNLVLVAGAGVVGLIVGLVIGFFAGKMISSASDKEQPEKLQPETSDQEQNQE